MCKTLLKCPCFYAFPIEDTPSNKSASMNHKRDLLPEIPLKTSTKKSIINLKDSISNLDAISSVKKSSQN